MRRWSMLYIKMILDLRYLQMEEEWILPYHISATGLLAINASSELKMCAEFLDDADQ